MSTSELPTLDIWVGTTYFKVPTDRQGKTPAGVSVRNFVKHNLVQSEFDFNLRIWVPVCNYSIYSDVDSAAYFPRYTLDDFIAEMSPNVDVVQHQLPYVKSPDVSIELKPEFSPREHQLPIIQFLSDPNTTYKPLSAGCGTGKTASSIAAMSKLGGPVLIVLGMLIDQWYKEIFSFTTLTEDEVVIVRGHESLKKLWGDLDNGIRPKVVIFSTRTLSLYCDNKPNYSDVPPYSKFLEVLGVRTKIFDECHKNFYANTRIDLVSNVQHNIYLSATYSRSDASGKTIFNKIYPKDMRYGEGTNKRYTEVYCYSYKLGIPEDHTTQFNLAKGYLHPLYESYLLRHKKRYFQKFLNMLFFMIDTYWRNIRKPNQKLLILCRTQKFVLALEQKIYKHYRHYKKHRFVVRHYFSGDTNAGSRDILNSADIIVSTMNSASTGIDIPGLKTCINTVSFSSEPSAAQALGRLREIPGEPTIYVDVRNSDIPQHGYHYFSRRRTYLPRALFLKDRVYKEND